jgi:hypothetical protein
MVSEALRWLAALALGGTLIAIWAFSIPTADASRSEHVGTDVAVVENARLMLDEGRRVFRFETFGDEAFWGDTLKLHLAIAGSKQGGVGTGVRPKTALSGFGQGETGPQAKRLRHGVVAHGSAGRAMYRRSSPRVAGTRTQGEGGWNTHTRGRRLALTIFSRIDHLITATAPHRSGA